MKDIQKIKEFFSKPLEESTFKKGDKVTYLGSPGEITGVSTDNSGRTHYSVSYKANTYTGRRTARGVYNKRGEIKMVSPSLEESTFKKGDKVTYLGHPGEITGVNKEMTGATTYNVAYDKGNGRTKVSNLSNKGGEIKMASPSLDESNGFTSGKQFINIKLKNYPKAVAKINQLIDMIGENKFTMGMAEWIWDFFNNASFESPVNEAKEEDKVDTITMDIPLFLRMLEYSREDASQDMDLHDVTEKANLLGKERGILQMEDYDEIVGTTKEINEVEGSITAPEWNSMDVKSRVKLLRYHFPKLSLKFADWKWEDLTPMIKNKLTGKVVKEGMGNEVGDKVYFKGDMGEKYPPSQGYYGIIEDTTPARNYNMMATYDVVVYDKNDNEIRTITTDFTNLTTKKVNEASDYMKRRQAQDDYAINKKDKPKKPYNPNPTGKTDYMKRREKELAEVILAKLKK